ncbi:MAG: NAD(P)/FAD-dependent oxidoreductase, partial [Pseudomonadota bacterium]
IPNSGHLTGQAVGLSQDFPTNPDVVIIGAGSAGLSAGRKLRKKGLSFVIVEGADRVGGRAYTESQTFGVPVDHGCSWISGSDKNPFTKFASDLGYGLVEHTRAGTDLFDLDGNPADEAAHEAYDEAWDALTRPIGKAGKKGRDVAAADVIPNVRYGASVQSWMGSMDYGVNFDQISTRDFWNTDSSQPSMFVSEGLGSVVATLADGLPISLGTQVTEVDWSGTGVSVETSKGTIKAGACLITVSTGVLAANKIKFTPELPDWKQQAAHDIPMGLLIKVPMLFDGARLGLTENNWVTYELPDEQAGEGCFFIAWPCSHDYVFGNIGGRFGWELYAEGQEAVLDYAMQEMLRLVGSDARKHFIKGFATDWADNPLTLGAYGAVRPGAPNARDHLAEPLGDRLFFAGEATHKRVPALVNGAYLSGKKAAKKMLKVLA